MVRTNVQRGSEWNKWDLHCHVIGTNINNCFGSSEDEYLQALEESDVLVFGLTDYWTSNKQFEIIEKFHKKFPDSKKKFFVNVEFRLNERVNNTTHVNFHLIFDGSIEVKNSVSNFISSINLIETKENGVKKKIIDLCSEADFQSAVVTRDELKKKLNEHFGIEKPYFKIAAASGYGAIRPDIKETTRNGVISDEVDKFSDFFFGTNSVKDYYLNKESSRYPNSIQKATLLSSDAHYINAKYNENGEFEHTGIGSKFTWIKSDPTIEGLRQILYEPEDRVSMQESKPEQKNDYQVIDRIEFEQIDSSNKNVVTTVPFNQNLNTIIGGRSNGKSTLTNTLAKTLNNPRFIERNESTGEGMFVFKETSNIRIIWKDGQINRGEENKRNIEFLPQDYMIRIAENDNLRNTLIEDTVKADKENYQKILDFDLEIQKKQMKIEKLLREWSDFKSKLYGLIAPEGDKKGIEEQILKFKSQVAEQRKLFNFSEEDNLSFEKKQDALKKAQSNQDIIKSDIYGLNNIKSKSLEINTDFYGVSNSLQVDLQNFIDKQQSELNEKWQNKLSELFDIQIKKEKNVTDEIQIIVASEAYKKGQNNISSNETLLKLTEQIEIENNKLEALNEYEKKRNELEIQTVKKEDEILKVYSEFKVLRNDISKNFKVEASPVEIELNFLPIGFEKEITYLHARNNNNNDFIRAFDKDSDAKIQEIFKELELSYNQNKNHDELIKDILSNQWFKRNYSLKYDNDNFLQMSQGKKAFVILSLILEFSKDEKPVVIDQPEDSLDNRAIYNDLTRYLKTKKRQRQIILVTHNPNVVVGSDSENVIIANQHSVSTKNLDDIQFDYLNGSLENSLLEKSPNCFLKQKSIRGHVIEILEGGNEAFEKRENKYNFR